MCCNKPVRLSPQINYTPIKKSSFFLDSCLVDFEISLGRKRKEWKVEVCSMTRQTAQMWYSCDHEITAKSSFFVRGNQTMCVNQKIRPAWLPGPSATLQIHPIMNTYCYGAQKGQDVWWLDCDFEKNKEKNGEHDLSISSASDPQ